MSKIDFRKYWKLDQFSGRASVNSNENQPKAWNKPEISYQKWLYTAHGQWYAPSAVINHAWYCMVLHDIAWYCIVLRGIAWYCMVLHGIALLHGIAWL